MRINEVLVEQQLDELGLADIGRGIEKGIGGLAKGAGYIAGIPGGLKQQFQTGKARATAGVGGTMAPQAAQPNPTFTQALQNYQNRGTASAGQATASDPAGMRKQAQELMKQADAAERTANQAKAQSNQQTQATQPAGQADAADNTTLQSPEQIRQSKQAAATGTAQQQMAANPAAPAKPAANFGQQPMGYAKTTTNTNAPQGTPNTSSPNATVAPLQAQQSGKNTASAALLKPKPSFARTAESVEFHSKFLGREL